MKLTQVEWVPVGKAVLKEYSKDDVAGLSAEMAYHFMFAIFPFVVFLAALAGFIGSFVGSGQLFDTIMSNLYGALPSQTADALRGPLEGVLRAQRGGALSIGAVLALWAASNGVATLMKALNRAYGVEETRNVIVRKVLAVGLTLVLTTLLVFGFVLLLLGGYIGDWLSAHFGLGGLFQVTWAIVRLVGVLAGITLAMAILYWKGPNVDQQFQWITPGSLITTVVWILATVGFGFYVRFLGASSYSKTYGTAFGLMLFMFYLYLSSQVMLLGAELNAETAKRYDPETIRDKTTDSAKQLPGEQPAPHPEAAREAGVSRRQVTATNAASAAKLSADHGSPTTANAQSRASGAGSAAVGSSASVDVGGGSGRKTQPASGADTAKASNNGRADDAPTTPAPHLADDAEPDHKDRTKIATAAVTAATVAGAVVLGALHWDDEKKAA